LRKRILTKAGARPGDGRAIGYARISKGDAIAAQIEALRDAGAVKIFKERASGGNVERVQLKKAIAFLRPGDVLIVWKIDRLARSLADLLSILATIKARGVGFRSITEAIDTKSAAGEMLLHMLGAFAQFERAIMQERTRLGLDAARRNGVKLGPRFRIAPDQARLWVQQIEGGALSIGEAARGLDVSVSTINRILARSRKGGHDETENKTGRQKKDHRGGAARRV
jgi:DNA invertase Pin-like site-specific DNA recombinase